MRKEIKAKEPEIATLLDRLHIDGSIGADMSPGTSLSMEACHMITDLCQEIDDLEVKLQRALDAAEVAQEMSEAGL